MSLWQQVVAARERFIRAGIPPDQAAIDAEVLARHAREWDRATYLTRRDESLAPDAAAAYEALVARRERREPVAYITGRREFWNLEFLVTPAVLIPRPESEFIIEAALARLRDRRRAWAIADVGTGSGCLAITLAHELPASRVTATDISQPALTIARQNAERLGVADRVTFVETSLLADAPGPFDLIVANPPYVPSSSSQTLSPDVRDHEPAQALYGDGEDGLDHARALLAQAPSRLSAHGVLLMEFGFAQGEAVRAAVRQVPALESIEILRDLQGHERTLIARSPPIRPQSTICNPQFLPRRPPQVPSGQQVQMDVEHRLTGFGVAVEHGAIPAFRVTLLRGDGRRGPHQLADQRFVSRREVTGRRDVPFRHDQDMQRRLWVDVVERHQVRVLMNLRRRDLPGDNAAEEAGHGRDSTRWGGSRSADTARDGVRGAARNRQRGSRPESSA